MPKRLLFLLASLIFLSACGLAPPAKKELPPAQQTADPGAKLSEEIKSDFALFDGKAGVYAKNLTTGKTFAYNQDLVFPTASTHKLLVTLATYKYLYPGATPAKQQQYDQNVKKMITVSDNPAFYEMLQEIEKRHPDALTKVLSDLKLVHTRIHSREAFQKYGYHSVTTPYEMALVFEAIYGGQYLGPEKSAMIKDWLSKTIFKKEIPRFMETRVLHKTGELPGVLTDVGIIEDGKNAILISAYTTPKRGSEQGSNFIATSSAKIYNLLRDKNSDTPR